jgi:hypothetical protein
MFEEDAKKPIIISIIKNTYHQIVNHYTEIASYYIIYKNNNHIKRF